MKIPVIINPKAGSVRSLRRLVKQISRLAPDRRHTTRGRGSAKLFAAGAIREGCDYIIAAGGVSAGGFSGVVDGKLTAQMKKCGDHWLACAPPLQFFPNSTPIGPGCALETENCECTISIT